MNPLPFEIPPDIVSFLQLMITPTFGSWAVSAFVENEGWFQKLSAAWKSRAVLIILLALSVLGRVGLSAMYGHAPTGQDIYLGVIVAFVSYVSSKWYHVKVNEPSVLKTSETKTTTTQTQMTGSVVAGNTALSADALKPAGELG